MGLVALLVASCASPTAGPHDSASSEALPQTSAREDSAVEAGGGNAEADSAFPIVGAGTEASGRELVHTADLTVRVEDVAEAARKAGELTVAAGGHIASESLATPTGGTPRAHLTLRIPQEEYESTLEDLSGLGDRADLSRSVEDVTGEVADTESRIESAETALETLRGYLEEADDVDELLRVEREIHNRQSELEAVQARLKTLQDRTAFSTVDLSLLPPRSYIEESPGEGIGFLGGLERGLSALLSVLEGLAVAAGWLLPFAAVLAAPVAALLWWLRRRRRTARALVRAGVPGAAESTAADGDEGREGAENTSGPGVPSSTASGGGDGEAPGGGGGPDGR